MAANLISLQIISDEAGQLSQKLIELATCQVSLEHPNHLVVADVLPIADMSTVQPLVMSTDVSELDQCLQAHTCRIDIKESESLAAEIPCTFGYRPTDRPLIGGLHEVEEMLDVAECEIVT